MKYLETLKKLVRDDSGQDLIEYALIAAMLALAAVVGLKGMATKIDAEWTAIGAALT
jgi:pilus assembly protein Flp/PilA